MGVRDGYKEAQASFSVQGEHHFLLGSLATLNLMNEMALTRNMDGGILFCYKLKEMSFYSSCSPAIVSENFVD